MSVQDPGFARELETLLNRYNAEDESNTPDFMLAEYLVDCLNAYSAIVRSRASWYGRMDVPGQGSVPYPTPAVRERTLGDDLAEFRVAAAYVRDGDNWVFTTPSGRKLTVHFMPGGPETEKKTTF